MHVKAFFLLFLVAHLSGAFAQSYIHKIDPVLLQKNHLVYDYVLMFSDINVSSEAKKIKGKNQKAKLVYQLLKSHASNEQTKVIQFLKQHNIGHRPYMISNCISVKSDYDLMLQLAAFKEVTKVVYNFPIHAERYEEAENQNVLRDAQPEWGIRRIQADSVWSLGYKGEHIVVAGEDTGYDWKVEPLRKKYRGYVNDSIATHAYNWHDGVKEKSPLSADSLNPCGFDIKEPCDDNNHGTHTMGTMVGSDSLNNIGVAPSAKWIGCRNMERGNGQLSTYLNCFEWFLAPTDLDGLNPNTNLAPHVLNNSWFCSSEEGCNSGNWGALENAVRNLKASGVVVVVSAGNSGPSCETVSGPPAFFEPSFAVGATAINDTITSFSSRGPVAIDSSYRMKPDISAPGRSIRSVIRGGNFATFNGTSMAGPHVAGAVALLINANPQLAGEVDIIENILKETADHKFSDQECGGFSSQTIPNPIYGYGRLNVLKAVELALKTTVEVEEESTHVSEYIVFPNPTTNFLKVTADHEETVLCKILTFDGRVVLESPFVKNLQIDASHFQRGTYFLELLSNRSKEIIKVIKL